MTESPFVLFLTVMLGTAFGLILHTVFATWWEERRERKVTEEVGS